jgi:putative aminopeptidase FrvX
VSVDRVGSVTAIKSGRGAEPRPRLLLAAHMDEIGLMVKQIVNHNGFGFLRLSELGGVDVRHLYGQTAVVHGKRDLVGVIGSLPGRMLPEERSSKAFGYRDLVVDVGLAESDVADLVSVGDAISFRQPLRTMHKRIVTGKALDNRASVAAVTLCLDYLRGRHFDWDVVAVATAQEETRLLGAFTRAFAEQPDAAIAIDVSFAKGAGLSESALILGDGPAIDSSPSVHPGMGEALQDTAKALEMKVASTASSYPGGTDAFALQIARAGIPTALVSIPLRYMHTMVETVHADDVERAGRLLGEFIARLDDQFLAKLAKGMMEA